MVLKEVSFSATFIGSWCVEEQSDAFSKS